MVPLIKSGQKHILAPVELKDVKIGDIVYCKVNGRLYTHKVFKIEPNRGALIGNNKGHLNGWTKLIYGKVIEVL
jgi:SOS-response transcriptional repressor LexA